jgi:carbon storage regulator
MLVLSRKVGQRIVLGTEIEITVLDIRGSKVRLGVTAPGDVSIQRSERLNRVQQDRLGQLSHPHDAQAVIVSVPSVRRGEDEISQE